MPRRTKPESCPAYHFVDTGDLAEPLECDLPIGHNADDVPWHQSGYASDTEELTVRWLSEVGEYSHWPPPQGPPMDFSLIQRMTSAILGPIRVYEALPIAAGKTITFRKWESLPIPPIVP